MCKQCMDMAREIFPDANKEQLGYILMVLTPFPFVEGEPLRKILLHIKRIGLKAAAEEAEAKLNDAMSKL